MSKKSHFAGVSRRVTMSGDHDASTYSLYSLKRMKSDPKFKLLDFQNVETSVIDEVFPVEVGRGQQDPPADYRTSAKRIREWRRFSEKQQQDVVANVVTVERGHPTASRSGRKRLREESQREQEQDPLQSLVDTITDTNTSSSPQAVPRDSSMAGTETKNTSNTNDNLLHYTISFLYNQNQAMLQKWPPLLRHQCHQHHCHLH